MEAFATGPCSVVDPIRQITLQKLFSFFSLTKRIVAERAFKWEFFRFAIIWWTHKVKDVDVDIKTFSSELTRRNTGHSMCFELSRLFLFLNGKRITECRTYQWRLKATVRTILPIQSPQWQEHKREFNSVYRGSQNVPQRTLLVFCLQWNRNGRDSPNTRGSASCETWKMLFSFQETGCMFCVDINHDNADGAVMKYWVAPLFRVYMRLFFSRKLCRGVGHETRVGVG